MSYRLQMHGLTLLTMKVVRICIINYLLVCWRQQLGHDELTTSGACPHVELSMTRSKVFAAQSSVWQHGIATDADAVAMSPLHVPDSDLSRIPGRDMAMQVAYGTGSLVRPHLSHEWPFSHPDTKHAPTCSLNRMMAVRRSRKGRAWSWMKPRPM